MIRLEARPYREKRLIELKHDVAQCAASLGRPPKLRVIMVGHHSASALYVALSGSPKAGPGVDETTLPPADRSADGIGVVDVRKRTLLRVLESGRDPEAFDVTPDGETPVPTHPVDGDPTGAGDAFAVTYLASRADGHRPISAARRATALVAALLGGAGKWG